MHLLSIYITQPELFISSFSQLLISQRPFLPLSFLNQNHLPSTHPLLLALQFNIRNVNASRDVTVYSIDVVHTLHLFTLKDFDILLKCLTLMYQSVK